MTFDKKRPINCTITIISVVDKILQFILERLKLTGGSLKRVIYKTRTCMHTTTWIGHARFVSRDGERYTWISVGAADLEKKSEVSF